MNEAIKAVANGPGLWICAGIMVTVVLVQAVLYTKLAFSAAAKVDLTREECHIALRTGIISSIGPALAIFIIMLGTISLVGAPLAWVNTVYIGSVATDLVGANIGAQVMGTTAGSDTYDLFALSASQWTMAINGVGFMLVAVIFTRKLDLVITKIGGGDKKWIAIVSIGATLGLFAYLMTPHFFASAGTLCAAIASALSMLAFTQVDKRVKKMKWLKEYKLGFSMVIGIVAGAAAVALTAPPVV